MSAAASRKCPGSGRRLHDGPGSLGSPGILQRSQCIAKLQNHCSLGLKPHFVFSTYDSTCQIAQEIAEKIQQRNRYERNGENTTK
ncbi:Syntaxin-8, partial [Manis javanica]